MDENEKPILEHGGYYSIMGGCPECGAKLSIRIQVGLLKPRKNRVTPEVREKIKAAIGTKTQIEIAAEHHVSTSFVAQVAAGSGKRVGKWSRSYSDIDPLLPVMRNIDIMRKLSVPYGVIEHRRRELDIKSPADTAIGKEKREKALKLSAEGFTQVEIGRVLRVSRQRVEQILKGL